MTGHTPAPWMFDHDWRRLPTIFGPDGLQKIAIIEKHSRLVRNPGPQRDLPEREANARLIAAAPDIKGELNIVWNQIEAAEFEDIDDDDDLVVITISAPQARAIRAALKKAKRQDR